MERAKSRATNTPDKELRRKEQLRAAQKRLRNRKDQSLATATSRVAELESLMTRTASTLRLCMDTCDETTKFLLETALADIESLRVESSLPVRTAQGSVESTALGTAQRDEATSSDLAVLSANEYFGAAMSQDDIESGNLDLALAFDDSQSHAPNLPYTLDTNVEQIIDPATEQSRTLLYAPSPASNAQTYEYDDRAHGIPRGLQLQSLAHHETTFARHIWRRAMEIGYNMLASSDTHPAWLERVFGNKFAYRTRSFVTKACAQALNEGQYVPIEFFNYPDFRQGYRGQQDLPITGSSAQQNDSFDSEAEIRDFVRRSSVSRSLMTPRDIEKFCLRHGFIEPPRQSPEVPETDVNSWTKPISHSNKLWVLDVEVFVSHLMTVCVSVDIQPSFPTCEILRMLLSSLRRVMPIVV